MAKERNQRGARVYAQGEYGMDEKIGHKIHTYKMDGLK